MNLEEDLAKVVIANVDHYLLYITCVQDAIWQCRQSGGPLGRLDDDHADVDVLWAVFVYDFGCQNCVEYLFPFLRNT